VSWGYRTAGKVGSTQLPYLPKASEQKKRANAPVIMAGTTTGSSSSSSPPWTVSSQQAWAALRRHARDDIAPLRLHELCRDEDRVSSLVAVYNTSSFVAHSFGVSAAPSTSASGSGSFDRQDRQQSADGGDGNEPQRILVADLSRQRMTLGTLQHLLQLSTARRLRAFVNRLAWGRNDPRSDPAVVPARVRGKPGTDRHHQQQQQQQQRRRQQQQQNAAARFPETEAPSSPGRGGGGSPSRRYAAERNYNSDSAAAGLGGDAPHDYSQPGVPIPSMHMSLRVPAGKGYEMLDPKDGSNVLAGVHLEWDRLERFSDCVRRGQLRGVNGGMIRDVVVVGRGVPIAALKFVYAALLKDERAVLASRFGLVDSGSGGMGSGAVAAGSTAVARIRRNLSGVGVGSVSTSGSHAGLAGGAAGSGRRIKFLTSIDPVAAADTVSDLDAGSTLVISIALNGNEETGLATKTLKSWLLNSLGSNRRADHILAKHMLLVTGNDRIASVINKPESVHIVPEHSRCEAFSTFSPVALLPLSVVFGWPIVREFLDGAHDMDTHFVETNPRHNLPVLLALCDIWNDTLLSASSRIVTPFTEAFAGYPAFVGALEAQTCSRGSFGVKHSCSATVVDGGLDGSYDRAFYQSTNVMNSEVVMAMDTQITFNTSRSLGLNGLEDAYSTQDALMCSVFAHADELAFGYQREGSALVNSPSSPPNAASMAGNDGDISAGNRPSLLLMLGKLDAFACGQLIAVAEHRAVVKAHIWGLDPFVREVGPSLRMYRSDQLKDDLQRLFVGRPDGEEVDESDSELNLSTKTILGHYASMVRDQRLH